MKIIIQDRAYKDLTKIDKYQSKKNNQWDKKIIRLSKCIKYKKNLKIIILHID